MRLLGSSLLFILIWLIIGCFGDLLFDEFIAKLLELESILLLLLLLLFRLLVESIKLILYSIGCLFTVIVLFDIKIINS